MRRIFKSRKRAFAALSTLVVLAFAGAAIAYLSSTGGGTGTGNVTASSSTLVLTFSQSDFSALPQTQAVDIFATNNGQSNEWFGGLASFSVAPASTSCPAGSFVATTPAVTAQEVDAGQTVQVGTVNVTFTDLGQVQNGCLGSDAVNYSATSN